MNSAIYAPTGTQIRRQLDQISGHCPASLAQELEIRPIHRGEVMQLFSEMLDLVRDLKQIAPEKLPVQVRARLANSLHLLQASLDQIRSFQAEPRDSRSWERCRLLEQVQIALESIQYTMICPQG